MVASDLVYTPSQKHTDGYVFIVLVFAAKVNKEFLMGRPVVASG